MKVRLETEAKLFIQTCIRDGIYSLCWSYMMDFENSNNPYEVKRSAIAPWKETANDYCGSSDDVLSVGQELMKLGVKANDALHIACAINRQCGYFITTDVLLTRKKITQIKIIKSD